MATYFINLLTSAFDTLEGEFDHLGPKIEMIDPRRFLDEVAEEAP